MNKPVYIIDASRTPFLKAQSKLGPGPFSASELAVQTGKSLLLRQKIAISDIDEVIIGCAVPSVDEVNIARVISSRIGCEDNVPAWTVMRNCASGMQALSSASHSIQLGLADVVLAGGTEALSHSPLLFSNEATRWFAQFSTSKTMSTRLKQMLKFKPKMLMPIIGILKGLTDSTIGLNMGQTAENLAHKFSISKAQADEYSLKSHKKSTDHEKEIHSRQITSIYTSNGSFFNSDDGIRPNIEINNLEKLKPVFDRPDGTISAGNSSQITDGACLFLLASEKAVKKFNLEPIGAIIDEHWAGLNPAEMGLGPIHAFLPIIQRNKLNKSSIDVWEINEAFAAQVLACQAALESDDYCKKNLNLKEKFGQIDEHKLNIAGGAISLGHPVGASGARIVLNALHLLKYKKGSKAIASICIGGGQGGAMFIEGY
ncbi:MAG: acetyl-CoA acetyltransferase [Betaproteobacteria bacterium TMED41]|nr:MAG: acetyl-CoA acetyltransferase [Betaproteobacteria bacterium TMED41]